MWHASKQHVKDQPVRLSKCFQTQKANNVDLFSLISQKEHCRLGCHSCKNGLDFFFPGTIFFFFFRNFILGFFIGHRIKKGSHLWFSPECRIVHLWLSSSSPFSLIPKLATLSYLASNILLMW